ncbi:hypothetical protein RA19_07355 [Leisingera sp. ANG-M1]|nr:hypothetical protein RA19_07355 [Leisingera sp. ANG-M1]
MRAAALRRAPGCNLALGPGGGPAARHFCRRAGGSRGAGKRGRNRRAAAGMNGRPHSPAVIPQAPKFIISARTSPVDFWQETKASPALPADAADHAESAAKDGSLQADRTWRGGRIQQPQ